jgi:ankyrin repeat protein
MLDSYGIPGLVNSVRENDLIHAQKLYDDGLLTCNACNRFGESILHMACRRGHIDMVNFLVNTVGLSITNIKDDYHRTPLHDAFWSSSIHKYNIVNLLLSSGGVDVIELLFCKDKRGYTPLEYARSEDYSKWYSFLYDRKSILRSSLSVTTTTTTTKKKNTIQMIGDIVDVVDIVAAEQQQKQQHDNNSNKRQRLTHNIIG